MVLQQNQFGFLLPLRDKSFILTPWTWVRPPASSPVAGEVLWATSWCRDG